MEGMVTEKRFWIISIFIIFALSLSFSASALAEDKLSVLLFGASGDGEKDETEFIQKAIDFQSEKGGGIVYFPKGSYKIDALKSINLKDDITLEFEEGTILKAIPNDSEASNIIKIHDVKNVSMIGRVEIQGERKEHIGTLGEWGMGISIKGSNNIRIENPIISNNWGDGIYIGSSLRQNYSENIKIIDPIISNNRRQGISIISVKNLEIINAVITNTNGTMPQAGIDIEPNSPLEFLENIKILNLSTEQNLGSGLLIYLANLKGTKNPISIYVDSTKRIKDGYSIRELENLEGQIDVEGYYYLTDKEIVEKPIVNALTASSTALSGNAPIGSTITVKAGSSIIGTSITNNLKEFIVKIPKQKIGMVLTLTATDIFGNASEESIVIVKAEKFFDIESGHWFYNEILYLSEKKIIEGFPNGSFQPKKYITRAEAAKMLATALNIASPNKTSEYPDVYKDHWAKKDIEKVTAAGLFNGYPDGSFRPEKNITRAEIAKILVLAFDLDVDNKAVFKDVPLTHWASKPVSGVFNNNITKGFPDNTFRPNTAATRAEFSVFLSRALNKEFR